MKQKKVFEDKDWKLLGSSTDGAVKLTVWIGNTKESIWVHKRAIPNLIEYLRGEGTPQA
jgi:alkyl hydroperoxide reductase subunit AhpC